MVISNTVNDFGFGYDIHKLSGMSLFLVGCKALRVDVRTHIFAVRVHHVYVISISFLSEYVMQRL